MALNLTTSVKSLPEPFVVVLRACKVHFVAVGVFSALVNILYLAPSIYMMQVYDRVIPTGGRLTLVYVTLVIAFALGALAALDQVRSRLLIRVGLRIDRLMADQVMERLLAHTPGAPRLGQAMREFDHFRQGLSGPGALALFDAPWTPFYLIVAFLIHPWMGVFATAAAMLLFGLALLNERATKGRLQEAATATAAAYASQEMLGANGEVVRALGMRRTLVARHLKERRQGLVMAASAQLLGGRYSGTIKFLRLLLQSLALGLGAWLAVEKQISTGSVIAVSILLSRSLQPVEQLVGAWNGVVQARTAFQNLLRLFETTQAPGTDRTLLPRPRGELSMERVVVRAPDGEGLLLKGVSLRLSPGEGLGVIGPSGAGKTTLARVAAGGLIPDQGAVRLDGSSYAGWDSDRLGQHIGYMPQDIGLMAGTVKENIARFATAAAGASEELDRRVIAAAMDAGAHEMIQRLPGGYDTVLGLNGRGLSAGQGQRVALARALFGEPALLIFDEPNAFLDAEGEAALVHAIRNAKARGAAVLMVAHRHGVLAAADRLLVMRDGVVEKFGLRDEIIGELSAVRPAAPSPVAAAVGH